MTIIEQILPLWDRVAAWIASDRPVRTDARSLMVAALIALAVMAIALYVVLLARGHSDHHGASSIFYDSSFYFSMASHGIDFDGSILTKQNAAFMPGYAVLLAPMAHLLPHNPFLAVLLTSAALSFVLGAGLFLLARAYLGVGGACVALALLFFSPYSVYLFNGYSEPAFLACAIWSLIALRTGHFSMAAMLAGYALMSRPYGIVLVVIIPVWLGAVSGRRQFIPRLVDCAFWCMLPAACYSVYAYVTFGDPLLYVNALEAWRVGNDTDGTQGIVGSLEFYVWEMGRDVIDIAPLENLIYAFFIGILSLAGLKKIGFVNSFFVVTVFLFEITVTVMAPLGVGRHILICFPAFIAIAALLSPDESTLATRNYIGKCAAYAPAVLFCAFQLGWSYANTLRYFNVEWVS